MGNDTVTVDSLRTDFHLLQTSFPVLTPRTVLDTVQTSCTHKDAPAWTCVIMTAASSEWPPSHPGCYVIMLDMLPFSRRGNHRYTKANSYVLNNCNIVQCC